MFSLKAYSIKRTVTGMCIFSLTCIKLVNKKILSTYYIRYTQKARRKKLLLKNRQQQEDHSQTIMTSRFKCSLYGRIYMKINTIFLIHTCYTSSILSCILKENFQKPTHWIFRFFSYSCRNKFKLIHLHKNVESTATISINVKLKVT